MAQLKDTTITGTLGVSGDTTVRGTLSAGSSTSLNTLYVANAVTFDEAPKINAVSASSILKLSSTKNITNAVANTDYLGPVITGTWTPVLRGLNTAGSWSYSTRIGKYWKINKMVYVMLSITAYQSSAGAGELFCSLPITPAATGTYTFSGSINFCSGGSNNYVRKFRYFEFLGGGCTWRAVTGSDHTVYASDVASLGTGSSNQFTLRATGWYICN